MSDSATTPQEVETPQNDPSSFLNEIRGNDVVVKLNSGLEYHGKFNNTKMFKFFLILFFFYFDFFKDIQKANMSFFYLLFLFYRKIAIC